MKWWQRGLLACMAMCVLAAGRVSGQAAAVTDAVVRGTVVDASGAQVGAARVHAEAASPVKGSAVGSGEGGLGPDGRNRDITADGTGHFLLTLPAGTYTLTVQSAGFDPYFRENLKLDAGQHIELRIKLLVAAQTEVVNVQADASTSTDPADNKSAQVFKGDQLQVLSDDPTLLQQQLTAIAGGDPDLPPQILVDGFTNGQFPPKSSIREIRINQNPYSAQYDQPGQGRVEIFTKPGSNTFHGFFALYGNDNVFNAPNPYLRAAQLPYHREHLFGDISGPLNKKTSFDASVNFTDDENSTPINATVLDSGLNATPFQSVISSPSLSQSYSGRLDRQFGKDDTVTLRYSADISRSTNSGVGVQGLASQAIDSHTFTQILQAGDTHVAGTKVVMESRFQYSRTKALTDPVSTAPTLIVQGSFNGGGAAGQALHDHLDRYEFQEYVSVALKNHFIRTGARYRLTRDANLSTGGFNGQYIFQDIDTYARALRDVRAGLSGAQIAAQGDGPSQFNVTAGQPTASVMTGDAGIYAEDDWKARPDLTVSFGGRLESQSAIPDHLNLAPRVGAAWAPVWKKGKTPFMTLRAGFGMFYDRIDSGNLLQTIRQNGARERGYYVQSPQTFGCSEGTSTGTTCTPVVPSLSSLTSLQPSIYRLSPNLHAEYTMQGGITADHRFGDKGSASINWIRSRGVHYYELRNVNAPLPGTYVTGNPASGTRPFGTSQNVYQYSSDGLRNLDQLRFNGQYQPTHRSWFWLSYAVGSIEGDTAGAGSLPSNQYDVRQDYGPVFNNSAERLNTGGGGELPFGFSANVYISFQSRRRFNITTGQDLNGDTSYNDRPAFATDLTRPSVVQTAFGNFDTSPMPGQTIVPRNYGTGPALLYTEMYLARNFRFGSPRAEAVKAAAEAKTPEGKPKPKPERPYRVGLALELDNVLNHTNPGPPVGILPAALATQKATQDALSVSAFGKPVGQSSAFTFNGAANRTIHLGLNFEF